MLASGDGKGEGVLVVIGQTLCRHSMASDDVLDILLGAQPRMLEIAVRYCLL